MNDNWVEEVGVFLKKRLAYFKNFQLQQSKEMNRKKGTRQPFLEQRRDTAEAIHMN